MNSPRIGNANDSDVLQEAVEILRGSGVVAMPTETVYGLAGCSLDTKAIEKIYALKGRPSNNPLIAHVLDGQSAQELVREGAWHDVAERLAQRFWPGPLTLVLDRSPRVPTQATGGLDSIAIRSPRHPVARDLLEKLAAPLSAPSANRSGSVSPTSAQHVAEDFPESDLMILDGGACEVGLESTVLDVRDPVHPRLLRPGSVSALELEPITGSIDVIDTKVQDHSPGTSSRHYAPKTRLELVDSFKSATERDAVIRFSAIGADSSLLDIALGDDPEVAGQGLYAALRAADTSGAERILAQRPPDAGEWAAIADRLQRASEG